MTSPNELKRPRELEFALEFCGNPEETIARQYIEALEARVALAQPEPEGVTAGELQWPPSVAQGCHEAAAEAEPGSPMQQLLVAAGDLLENYARPAIQPVPVTEHPWERQGWCDADGRCWWYPPVGTPYWQMVNPATHVNAGWLLPAHALPIPQPTQPPITP
jgi:hypothetical protein